MGGCIVNREAAARPYYDAIVDLFPLQAIPAMAYALVKFVYLIEEQKCVLTKAEPMFHDIRDPEIQPRLLPGSEFWTTKYATDVVVRGNAFAPYGKPVNSMRVFVRVGNTTKQIQVWGERIAEWKPNVRPVFSQPEPFIEVPLIYANAYGGTDPRVPVSDKPLTPMEEARLEADHPGIYPRNPFGKGYVVLPDPAKGVRLPMLEDPDDLLTPERLIVGDPKKWYKQPLPWCYEYTNPLQFPRFVYLGLDAWFTPPDDHNLPEVYRGYITPNYRSQFGDSWNPVQETPSQYFQEASLGMVFQDLYIGTPFSIKGMHPEEEVINFTLPKEPLIEIEIEGQKQGTKPQLSNMLIEPAEKKVSLVYVARTTDLPRVLIPGIHGYIPLAVIVNKDRPVIYETPPTIRDQLKAARKEKATQTGK